MVQTNFILNGPLSDPTRTPYLLQGLGPEVSNKQSNIRMFYVIELYSDNILKLFNNKIYSPIEEAGDKEDSDEYGNLIDNIPPM